MVNVQRMLRGVSRLIFFTIGILSYVDTSPLYCVEAWLVYQFYLFSGFYAH